MKTNPEDDQKIQEDTGRPPMTDFKMNGPKMSAEEYVRDRLDSQMNYYDRKSSWNQNKYKKFKRWEIILAASIPVVITVSQMPLFMDHGIGEIITLQTTAAGESIQIAEKLISFNTVLQLLAATAGVLLVILHKYLELGQYFETWKTYRATATELQQERIKFLARVDPYDEEEEAFDSLVDSVEAILNKENSSWKERTKNRKGTFEKAQKALQEQAAHIQEVSYERDKQDLDKRATTQTQGTVVQQKATPKAKAQPKPVDEYEPEGDYDQPDAYDQPEAYGEEDDSEIG